MRIVLASLLITALWLVAALPAHAGEVTTEAGHVVRWDEGLEDIGPRVAKLLPGIRQEVEVRLGFEFGGGPATVWVVSGLDRIRAEAGSKVPEWAGGVCVSFKSLIVLRADRIEPPTPFSSANTVLRHEWVHLAWARRSGKHRRQIPLWLEEGLAEEIGGGISVDAGASLDFAAAFDRLIPFDEIDDRFPANAGRAGLAYQQGRSWVRFFVAEAGWRVLHDVLLGVADGDTKIEGAGFSGPFEYLIWKRTDQSVSQWHARWRSRLEETADPWYHLLGRDLTGTIFFGVALIAAVAFFVMRSRRKKAFAELPDG